MSALLPTYARTDVAFTQARGSVVIAENGDEYLDFGAGIGVNSLGHAHPHLVTALSEQAQRLWHTSNLYRIPDGERLAKRLCEATFAEQVFFTNSGGEAMECAVKMARKYHSAAGSPERFRVITFEGAFHGRTLAMIAAGNQAKHLDGFGPKTDGFDQVPFADLEAVKQTLSKETAAILIEPVQGEGGIRPLPNKFLQQLRALCDDEGILLIFDEVQCGVGRTGRLFAYQHAGIAPDIMGIAKAIGGGFPLGACLATKAAAAGMTAGSHGSTFGGNPLAMAIGNAVLDVVLEEGFLQRVDDLSKLLRQKLAYLADQYNDIIEDIRGSGLMIGIKCIIPNAELVAAAFTEKLLLVPAGDNVVRLLPPLNMSDAEVDEAVARLEKACQAMRRAKSA